MPRLDSTTGKLGLAMVAALFAALWMVTTPPALLGEQVMRASLGGEIYKNKDQGNCDAYNDWSPPDRDCTTVYNPDNSPKGCKNCQFGTVSFDYLQDEINPVPGGGFEYNEQGQPKTCGKALTGHCTGVGQCTTDYTGVGNCEAPYPVRKQEEDDGPPGGSG